jgi:hypothetical protein
MTQEQTPDPKKEILSLITKAAEAHDSADAMRFTQAAVNAANALCALKTVS